MIKDNSFYCLTNDNIKELKEACQHTGYSTETIKDLFKKLVDLHLEIRYITNTIKTDLGDEFLLDLKACEVAKKRQQDYKALRSIRKGGEK